MKNSVVSAPDPPTPDPPSPAEPTQKSYNTSQFGKLIFRTMVGHSSLFYQGQIIVKQRQLPDGGYFAQFYKPDGVTVVSPSNATGSGVVDIRSLYKTIDGQYGLYISPGGGDVYQFLENTYEGAPPNPPPPTINPKIVHFATNSIKYLLLNANGSVYTADNFNVRYYYNPNNGNYQIQFQDLNGNVLSLSGQDLPPLASNGYYQMQYQLGKTFDEQWNEEFSGTPPTPGPPQPPIPTGYRSLRGGSNSAWKFLRLTNRDGTPYTGTYYIQYQQRSFRNRRTGQPEYDLQVANLTCFTIDSSGNKVYLNVNWGEVDFQSDSANPIYDNNGNIIGEKYSMTLPNNTSGAGSLEEFLTQFYSNNNEYPDPPPTPPLVNEFDTNTGSYKITFSKVNGERYTGPIKISYQFVSGQWQFSVKTADGQDTLRLEGDGVNIVGRHDGNPIYGLEYEDGVSFEDSFDGAYEGTPPAPGPDPGPVDPSQPRSMGTLNSADYAIVWLSAGGSQYDGVVKGNYIEARASDGKRVVYFTDSDGNRLQAHVPDGFSGWDPTIAPQPAHGRRIHEEVEYEVPDDVTNFSEAEQWFQNGCDVHGNAPPIPFGDSGLMVDGFILYHDEMDAFGVEDKIPDELKDAGIIGFVNYDGDYQRKEERYGFVPLPDQPKGGGDIFDRPEVAAPAERPASPTPYDEPAGAQEAEDVPADELADVPADELARELEYDRLEESFDEKEWISAKAVFAEQAYKTPDRRTEDVFGMQYVPDLSNERLALYVHPNSKLGVVALRGTQSAVDFISDLFVLLGVPGLSARYSVTKDELADIKERYPDMKFELIGHSLGGTITSELADEESVWRALGISTGHGTTGTGRWASEGIGTLAGVKEGMHVAAKSGAKLSDLTSGFFSPDLAQHFELAAIQLRAAPDTINFEEDFGLTVEAAESLAPLFEQLQSVVENGLNPVMFDRAIGAQAESLMQAVETRSSLIENLIRIGRMDPARESEVAWAIRNNLAANEETLRTIAGLEQALLSRLGPEEIRIFEQTVSYLDGHSRDLIRQGLDAFLRGHDPQMAIERGLEAMSSADRAEFFREIGLPELVPGPAQKALQFTKGAVTRLISTLALFKILGLGASIVGPKIGFSDYPLDLPKGSDVKVKDWLYGHGGKFTTIRGKNDIISSPDIWQWLVDGTPQNVRNIDLGSSLLLEGIEGTTMADHSLSNFIIKEHERFKRSGDDAKGPIQWSDLEFIAKVLKKIPGQREPEQL